MSCETPSSIARSLSPSEESRFVPHASIASSIMEQHFTPDQSSAKADEEKQAPDEDDAGVIKETGAAGNTTDDLKKEEEVAVDDEKSCIVGATICFTPESSPHSSPNLERVKGSESIIDSLNSGSNNYIGSVNVVASGDSGVEGASSKMSSSVRNVASSLDGHSTTEYEILDCISSKGSIAVEDLTTDSDDDEGSVGVERDNEASNEKTEEPTSAGNVNQAGTERATALGSLSPCSTIPSLGDTPFKIFKAPEPDQPKDIRHKEEGASSEALKAVTKTKSEEELKEQKPKDGSSHNTSPKVDQRSLSPFQNLHEYWEGQSSFTHMTKSAIERILSKETPRGVDDALKAPSTPSEGKHFSFNEVPGDPVADQQTQATEGMSEGQASEARNLAFTPRTEMAVKLKSKISELSNRRRNIRDKLASFCKQRGLPLSTETDEPADKTTIGKAEKATTATATAKGSADVFEDCATNLSKLFSDEAQGEQKTTAQQPKKSVVLDEREKELLSRINDNGRNASSGLKSVKLCCAIASCVFIAVISTTWNYLPQTGLQATKLFDSQEEATSPGAFEKTDSSDYLNFSIPPWEAYLSEEAIEETTVPETAAQTFKEDSCNRYCLSTSSTNYFSMSLLEVNLSPWLFESLEMEILDEQASEKASDNAGPSYWLLAFLILSTLISFGCAFIFKPKIQLPLTKSKSSNTILTGIWTEEEHQQFLEGYKKHGTQWKLVSEFVPTRTHTQVKSHGIYWLKIRSPLTMKKTRKVKPSPIHTPETRKKKAPATPSSVSSVRSTPKLSNRKKTPIKGILIEKDRNKLHKNVTPRSEGRTRRMMERQAQGSKSEPTKRRVRIRTP
mmetsp:Transcript_1445/g.2758  ORF Transcript_1445/g.2758 Transcript_1445/m.2758 type:complete len:846 (+) Transcript_1445:271-2808(+)